MGKIACSNDLEPGNYLSIYLKTVNPKSGGSQETTETSRLDRLFRHLPLAVGLLPPAHFRIFPYTRLAILFAHILVVTIFVDDKLFGLSDIGQRWVEGNTTVGTKGKPQAPSPHYPWYISRPQYKAVARMWHTRTHSDIADVPLLLPKDTLIVHLCALCSSLTKRILLDLIGAAGFQRRRRADKCRELHTCRYAVSQQVNWKFGNWKNRLLERQVVNSTQNNIRATYFYVEVFPRPASFASASIQMS
jgi:hypothetical protein